MHYYSADISYHLLEEVLVLSPYDMNSSEVPRHADANLLDEVRLVSPIKALLRLY